MDTLTAIKTRRSIRKYSNEPVERELLEELLAAAMCAPSAFDERPWHFVVIDSREILKNLEQEMAHCEMLKEANAGILICGDPEREKLPGFWQQDCSASTENILLAAHALSLGAVWIGLHPVSEREAAVRHTLAIPTKIVPFALVALGYPGENLPGENRYDPNMIHFNRW